MATAAGILSSGPVYVWYPLLAELRAQGMKEALVAVFLYNRAVKLPWLPVMLLYFGPKFTAVLTAWTVVAGVLEGLAMELWAGRPPGGRRR